MDFIKVPIKHNNLWRNSLIQVGSISYIVEEGERATIVLNNGKELETQFKKETILFLIQNEER